jgi:threonine synthase
MNASWPGLIEYHRARLPVTDRTPVVTLREGNTPLIPARNLAARIQHDFGVLLDIYLKFEGCNPTGSFKDRGMTMAISKAKEEGATTVICASTGNTSASAAAYAAKAGMRCIVLIPDGHIALGKLSQAVMHGAEVYAVTGNFDEALTLARTIAERYPVTLVNSLNPYRIEGQKTASFEIIEQLGRAPDIQCMPVGNAGNITAYWKGYTEALPAPASRPRMLGFQAAGAAPIVLGSPVEKPETVATAIRIGNPASWKQAVAARDESGGFIDTVTDDEILAAYYLGASAEGVFCEPASAASIAGLLKTAARGYFRTVPHPDGRPLTVVCILTGHGLKDPDRAIAVAKSHVNITTIPCDLDGLVRALRLG